MNINISEWNTPVDSRFIFKLLQKLSNKDSKNKLYKLLLLDANSGQAFAGLGDRTKHCWWPDHSVFFYQAYRRQVDEKQNVDIDLWCNDDQKFPLEKNYFLWERLANEINKKIQNPRSNYTNPNFIKKEITAEDVEVQLTFESHVYNVLINSFECFPSEIEKKQFILNFCKEEHIPKYEISKIEKIEEFEDILVYIITRAKDAAGTTLTVQVEEDTTKNWQILSANALKVDPMEISARIMENDRVLYNDLPPSCAGTQRQWADVFISFPHFCRFLINEQGVIEGNFSAVGLFKEQERKIQKGQLIDSEIDVSFCDPLQTRGDHCLYLLNLSVNHDVELDKYYALWDDLIGLIKKCAREEIYFTRIYYKAFLPEHRAMVIGRGFRFLCYDSEYGAIFVHEMNSESSLRFLDEELATLYQVRQKQKRHDTCVSNNTLEAEAGFQHMFKIIDELFRNSRFAELKPYYFSDLGLPEDEKLRQLGIATAELLRDILQYSKSLLEFLCEEFEWTYSEYADMIMESRLVKESMKQYLFATEQPDFQIKKIGIDTVNARDIVTFASIWINNDKLFIMRDDTLKLRPYFYEWSDRLPPEDEIPMATALVIRLLSSIKISESLLDRIPNHFVISYYKYKEMIRSIRIVREVIDLNPFLKDELNW